MEVYVLPLSLAQRQIWYQEIVSSGSTAYNIPIALRLVGNVDELALEKSFRQIIERHEVLRTTFAVEEGVPVQLIHEEYKFSLEKKILELPLEGAEESLRKILETESQRPFDLVKDQLMRIVLYQISKQEHILLVNLHHIISDGWSLGLLVKELTEFYSTFVQGKKVSLPELPIQYGDYAEWQSNWLESEPIQQQLAYWEKTLAAPQQYLDLPLDKLRQVSQTFNGAVLREPLAASLSDSVSELANAEGATFFMVALATYQVLLFRYSGQTDIVVGTPTANRKSSEIANLIGCFVNTLPLRCHIRGEVSFRQFLRQTCQTCIDAYAHQDVPLEFLIDKLEIQRNPSCSPIFQTLFALQNAPIGEIQLPELSATPIHLDNGGAKFDLTLMLEPDGDGWLVALEYNTDLFEAATAQQMLTHYQQLLTAAVSNPDVSINALPILNAKEKRSLLELSFASETAKFEPTNIIDIFSKSARNYSDKIAVVASEKELTYEELDQLSGQLANILQQKGVGRETRVGIFLERSEKLLISILAVLKAGGTYVPLDPQYPADRLRFIAEDSGIDIVLTESALELSIPVAVSEIVAIDKLETLLEQSEQSEQTAITTKEILPNQVAYIIYTSGSTGQPKGCLVTHLNVVRLMQSTEAWFGFNENDVWTLFHSFAFDFSVWEMWGALLYGGKLVVVPYLESRSPEAFRILLQQSGVTILNQTPSAFRQLISADKEFTDKLTCLRGIIFGGEALELSSLKPWIGKYGDRQPRLVNMYGITETTVHVTYRPILEEDIRQNRGSVIGKAIPDLSLYILDDNLEPTPIGVRGEMYVGGMGVSRGYLNRAQLTAQRFIPAPESKQPGARLYRTGDLARRLPNGDIEYLGRRDLQVKIRGFRIELGEIEAALTELPQVREATVIVHSDGAEDKRLVAYVVSNGDKDRNQLRIGLKERLPDYMIPAAFMFLDAMPLTAQGKINRKALPKPDWNQAATRNSITAPQTPAQKVICQVWEQVLGLDNIGIEDNFFDLGGDSILALKVVAEMRRQGWVLTPKEIFQEQTVEGLATVARCISSPEIISAKATGLVPLSPIQKWFFDLNIPNRNHWNQAIILEANQSLKPAQVGNAIKIVSEHHDSFRLRFKEEEGVWQQFYTEDNTSFSYEICDLAEQDESQQNTAMQSACEELQKSLDLTNGPVAGAIWFNLGLNRAPRLLIVIHHLIVDGVSWRILLQDLVEAIFGQELSAVTSSFQQWSQFLQQEAKLINIQAERKFWQDTIECKPGKLPIDFPKSFTENFESSVKKVSRKLSKEETQIFLTKANKTFRTQPQELLLAALGKTLSHITRESTLKIIMEGHGRSELSSNLDITRTIGWFTTLYPLRLELLDFQEDDNSIGTLIKIIKEQLRSVPNRGFGYGLLRYLDNENNQNNHSLIELEPAEISFNYLGQVRSESGKNKLFSLLSEDTEPTRDYGAKRPHLIDINGIVVEGELQIDWLYSSSLHESETISKWADEFQQNLQEILVYCTEIGVGGYTPSDFPLAKISQSSLDVIQEKYPNLEDIYPLSPLQSGMLFHSIDDQENGIYFEQVIGKIKGSFDVDKFNYAWQEVLKRHSTLRSAFVWENQLQPLQIVDKNVNFSIIKHNWRNLSSAEQSDKLKEYLIEDRQNKFRLDCPPLMRFTIIQLDDSTWQWIWSHHHITLDGWSLPILFKEVLLIYQSTCEGVPHQLAPVPAYRNYIQWILERNNQQAKEFWHSHLGDISSSTRLEWQLPETELELKSKLESKLESTLELNNNLPAYAEVELRLSEAEFSSLQKMAQNHRLTLNTIAQGAWAICLQKHGAGSDVVFGVTVSGRTPELAEVENMVGLFINTLPMRVRLHPDLTVAATLTNIQQHHVEMREYEYSKLTDIQKEISELKGESLFESILVFENYPVDKSLKEFGRDFQVDDIEFYERTNYPLTVGVIPDDGLLIKLNYQTKFLSATAAQTLLSRFKDIMVKLANQPNVVLGEFQALSLEECMVNQGKAKTIHRGDFKPAHQLFEAVADSNPDALALISGDKGITYGDLEKRANHLAAILISAGIGYESIVGLYFDASIDYIVALLAVLKAGAAFVPLDCNYPQARLEFIVENSQTHLILTTEIPAPGLFPANVKIIPLTEIDEAVNCTRLNIQIKSENLAYIIYTSGSTGKPKGVLVTHAGIENLVRCQTESFGVTAASRVYQFASLNFDAAISEIFMALGSGATLYLVDDLANRTPSPALWSALTAQQITHITLPPSLLAAIEPSDLPSLQTLIVAGESVSGDLLRRWSDGCQVFNAYGPTEATVCATIMNCSHLLGEPSIGKPIANVEVYLLDSFLQPVAPGVTGEIYIGGISLARGYLHRADLTAAGFIPHPFATQPGARLYKTGDRGVYDLQGNIRFLGRIDAQVKLNGYRIELGEIEAALTKHPIVDSAVVMVRQDLPGRKRIVGYVLTPKENPPTRKELQEHIAGVLPGYMVPSAIVLLTEWPLTPNGKINRQALPAPELPTTPIVPKTETEEILAQIWKEVLGVETVNPQDNFFALGGDSIISLQVVSRARSQGWEINPRDIFEAQTLSRLATKVKPLEMEVEVSEPLTGNVPLSPIQHWFFAHNFDHPHHWNQGVALSVREPLEIKALDIALEAVVKHHDVLRLKFSVKGGQPEQSYSGTAGIPSLRVEDLQNYSSATEQDILTAIVEEEHRSFDFDTPPLIRVVYVRNTTEYGDILYLIAHHLIVDAVSWRILVEDLNQAYHQVVKKQPISLPIKTTSYRNWTTSLESLANSEEIIKDIPFWENTSSTAVGKIPVDISPSEAANGNIVESAVTVECQLTPSETLTLLKSATNTYHASVQEIMLAALLKTLKDTYKSDAWLIDLEGHGREELIDKLDISRTVGWFTSVYPLLLQYKFPTLSPDLLLKAVKTQIRAIPHHGISFGLLRYISQNKTLATILANSQTANISFNYLGQTDTTPKNNNLFSNIFNNLFSISNAPTGRGVFEKQKRPHILAINARVQNECLQISWCYSKNIYNSQTIDQLVESYLNNLRLYLTDIISNTSSVYTATDFHLVELSENELDSILLDLED